MNSLGRHYKLYVLYSFRQHYTIRCVTEDGFVSNFSHLLQLSTLLIVQMNFSATVTLLSSFLSWHT